MRKLELQSRLKEDGSLLSEAEYEVEIKDLISGLCEAHDSYIPNKECHQNTPVHTLMVSELEIIGCL